MAVVIALMALHILTHVCDEFHLIPLIAQSSQDAEASEGQCRRDISSSQRVVSAVVVGLVHVLKEIQLVSTEVVSITQQRRHIHGAEALRQRVVGIGIPVNEVTGFVITRPVLSIGSELEFWCP